MKLISTGMFSVMLALGKAYSNYPVAELVFFRSAFALVPLVIWLLMRGDFPRALHTARPGGHLIRSFAGIGSMFCLFASYGLLPIADVTAIGYVAPLMIVPLAGIFLSEKISAFRWGAVSVGFLGVMIILGEHLMAGGEGPVRSATGATFAFTGAVLVSFAMIQTRRLTMTEDTGAITFYFQATTTLASALLLIAALFWPHAWVLGDFLSAQAWVWPPAQDWLPLILIGVFGGVGQIFMTQGYRYADASILAVFDYSSLLFAVAIGLVFFGETPSHAVIAGALLVVAAGLAVALHENRLRRAMATA
ncbi:DMT family transporter [Roseiarcaceae bacterium H3SJ34-1]|nr:DMT family transporter [Roseiarcaceae bacterium H3SJ34-1]